MLRATEVVRLGVALATMWACLSLLAQDHVLDLTKVPVSSSHSLGVPGSVGGGILGKEPTPPYELPLEVRIDKIEMRLDGATQRLKLKIEVVNRGSGSFNLPACVDENKAHGPGESGRRTFSFGVEFTSPKLGITRETLMEVTFGAKSNSQCSINLKPGEHAVVLMDTQIFENVRDLKSKDPRLEVRAFCSEMKLEDGRFFVSEMSRKVRSAAVELKLKTRP